MANATFGVIVAFVGLGLGLEVVAMGVGSRVSLGNLILSFWLLFECYLLILYPR